MNLLQELNVGTVISICNVISIKVKLFSYILEIDMYRSTSQTENEAVLLKTTPLIPVMLVFIG